MVVRQKRGFTTDLLSLERESQVVFFLVVCAIILGAFNQFLQDDAFISFRYAKNLAEHGNLSWNYDDVVRIEGYTNFLWTLILAVAMRLGIDPSLASIYLGLVAGAGTVFLTYRLAKEIFEEWQNAALAAIILATNYTFSAYMTGGLETQLQTFFLTWLTLLAIRAEKDNYTKPIMLLAIGAISSLALLTRLDSVIICGIVQLILVYSIINKYSYGVRDIIFVLIKLAAPLVIIVGPWLIWKYFYYGSLVPNSFHVKATTFSMAVVTSGLRYVLTFFLTYFLIPVMLMLAWYLRRLTKTTNLLMIFCPALVWMIYIVRVGGDFMEYRFFVPILPFLMILFTWAIVQKWEHVWLRLFMIATIVLGSVGHAVLFTDSWGIQSVKSLRDDVAEGKPNWTKVGVVLGELFAYTESDLIIATNAAGAIPYYSELNTVDMLGINDRYIAMHGEDYTRFFRPGHNKWAKLRYYEDSGVNLILGHPQIRDKGWDNGKHSFSLSEFRNFHIANLENEVSVSGKIVGIPISPNYVLYALYLQEHPDLEKMIERKTITAFDISE